jgi:hypothetical protein
MTEMEFSLEYKLRDRRFGVWRGRRKKRLRRFFLLPLSQEQPWWPIPIAIVDEANLFHINVITLSEHLQNVKDYQ